MSVRDCFFEGKNSNISFLREISS